jgi:mono/diheme cytochrome c family protein
MKRSWWLVLSCCWSAAWPVLAQDAHGRSTAPAEARRIKNPLDPDDYNSAVAEPLYRRNCAACHGEDGKARTPNRRHAAGAPYESHRIPDGIDERRGDFLGDHARHR